MLTFRSVAAFLFIQTIVSTGLSETHRFEPKVFYNTFSGAHPPALRIKPVDSVNTYTMGAGVTVMLLVFEPGALLFLGDGHARQGDGRSDGRRDRDVARRRLFSGPHQEEAHPLAAPGKFRLHHGVGQFPRDQRSDAARDNGTDAVVDGRLRIR